MRYMQSVRLRCTPYPRCGCFCEGTWAYNYHSVTLFGDSSSVSGRPSLTPSASRHARQKPAMLAGTEEKCVEARAMWALMVYEDGN